MKDQEIKIDIPDQQHETPHASAAAASTTTAAGSTGAIAPSRLLAKLGSSSALSPDAAEYLKQLEPAIKDQLTRITGRRVDAIEVLPVPSENATIYRVSYKSTHHILVGFSDTYVPPPENPQHPLAVYLDRAFEEMAQANMTVATTVIVTPGSYPLHMRMADSMSKQFLVMDAPSEYSLTLKNLSTETYSVVTNINTVRRLISDSLPTNIMPPTDIGMAVYANPTERGKDRRLLLLVGGTTIFVPNALSGNSLMPGDSPEYTRITVINTIISPTPSLSMALFGISLAADYFMSNNGWLQQFTDFTAGKPNIGNLIPDPNDGETPYVVSNDYQLANFVNVKLQPVGFLALDIADGAPRIPGIELLAANQTCRLIAEFTGSPDIQIDGNITDSLRYQFTGIFDDETDTRAITFLKLIAEDPKNAEQYKALLAWNDNPAFSLKTLETIYGSNNVIRPLFATTTAVLDSRFVNQLVSTSSGLISVTWDTGNEYLNNVGLPSAAAGEFGSTTMFGNKFSGHSAIGPTIYGGR